MRSETERLALTLEEIKTYCRIVTDLQRTIEIQEESDALYSLVAKRLVQITHD